jgi:hypothetical protein
VSDSSSSEMESEDEVESIQKEGESRRKWANRQYRKSSKKFEKQLAKKKERRRELRNDPDWKEKQRAAAEEKRLAEDAKDDCSEMSGVEEEPKKRYRYRKVEELCSDFLPKNRDGKVVLSKGTYNPEKGVRDASPLEVLRQEIEDINGFDHWMEQLKCNAGEFCKKRIIEEILENAKTLLTGYHTIGDIRDAWAEATTNEEQVKVGKVIDALFREGYFEERKGFKNTEWKFRIEKEVMEKYGLVYFADDQKTHDIGCFAKQASRSAVDIRKQIFKKGKKAHGKIVSKRRATRKHEGGRYDRKVEPPNKVFVNEYVRESEKLQTARKSNEKEQVVKPRGKIVDLTKVKSFVIVFGWCVWELKRVFTNWLQYFLDVFCRFDGRDKKKRRFDGDSSRTSSIKN